MKTYFTSDLHFCHEKIISYCSRPFQNSKEMDFKLIENWNSIVEENDIVYILGDIFFGDNWKNLTNKLNRMKGTKHLILGNHDRLNPWDYIEAGFTSLHTSMTYEDFILIHDPSAATGPKYLKWIHGHIHNMALNIAPNCFNVSVEMHGYKPVNFEIIREYFKNIDI